MVIVERFRSQPIKFWFAYMSSYPSIRRRPEVINSRLKISPFSLCSERTSQHVMPGSDSEKVGCLLKRNVVADFQGDLSLLASKMWPCGSAQAQRVEALGRTLQPFVFI